MWRFNFSLITVLQTALFKNVASICHSKYVSHWNLHFVQLFLSGNSRWDETTHFFKWVTDSLRANWEEKWRQCFLNIYVYCVYTFFLNLTKLVFFILPVASSVVHANRKHTLPPHLDCPHITSRGLQCCFNYSF